MSNLRRAIIAGLAITVITACGPQEQDNEQWIPGPPPPLSMQQKIDAGLMPFSLRPREAAQDDGFNLLASGTWASTTTTGAESRRGAHTMDWDGSNVLIFGGTNISGHRGDGAYYDPALDSWTLMTSTGSPSSREGHCTWIDGGNYYVFGGYRYNTSTMADQFRGNGEILDIALNTWTDMNGSGSPSRAWMACGQSSTDFFIWGGARSNWDPDARGRIYNIATDSWSNSSTSGDPSERYGFASVDTGTDTIIWGGHDGTGYVNTGGIYNYATDSWSTMSTTNAPSARASATVVWTGTYMMVWGGATISGIDWTDLGDGALYNPTTDTWTTMSTVNAPEPRVEATAVWTGSQVILWGGGSFTGSGFERIGSYYDPSTNTWTDTIETSGDPSERMAHGAVWTGTEMVVWGGWTGDNVQRNGGRLTP